MKNKKFFIPIIIVLIVIAAVYFVLPYISLIFGQPFYLIPPSPKKVGQVGIEIMDSQGIYADSEEWKAQKQDFLDKIEGVSTEEEVRDILHEAVKIAGGKHSFVMKTETKEEMEATYKRPETKFENSVLYVKLPDFMSTDVQANEYANIVANSFKQEGIKGVIVDLRENPGGNMYPMILGLSPILPDGDIITFVGKGQKDAFTVKLQGGAFNSSRDLEVENKNKLDGAKVAILTGDQTASSGEVTLMAFAGLDYAKSFGKETAGYSSANSIINLSDKTQMAITNYFNKDRTGRIYNEAPIEPDVVTDNPLEEAIKWINE